VGRVLGTLTRAKASWLRLTAVPHLPGAEHVPPVASDQSLEPWICLNLDNARTSRRLNFNSPNCHTAAPRPADYRAPIAPARAPRTRDRNARSRVSRPPASSASADDRFGKSRATFNETRAASRDSAHYCAPRDNVADLGDLARGGRAGADSRPRAKSEELRGS